MAKKQSEPPTPRGLSPRTVLLILFFLVSFAVGAPILMLDFIFGAKWVEFRRQNEIKWQEASQKQQEEAALQAKIAADAPIKRLLIAEARSAQTNCEILQYYIWLVRKQIPELRTNEFGRDISVNSDLLVEAASIMHSSIFDFPDAEDIARKEANARQMETNVEMGFGSDFMPDEQYADAKGWAVETARAAKNLSLRLDNFLSRAPSSIITKSSMANPSLGLIADGLTAAALNSRIRMQTSCRLSQQIYDASLEKFKLQLLRQRAMRFDVRQRLTSFLSPGYYMPGARGSDQKGRSLTKGPMSFSSLRDIGALDQTPAGIKRFAEIGASLLNDRRKLSIPVMNVGWYRNADLYAYVKSLQTDMIELGPTFVELGMMKE